MTNDAERVQVILQMNISRLSDRFLDRCLSELPRTRALMSDMRRARPGAGRSLAELVHRMSGTGGTLGLQHLSELARRVEQLADPPPSDNAGDVAPPDGVRMGQLEECLQTLELEILQLAKVRPK